MPLIFVCFLSVVEFLIILAYREDDYLKTEVKKKQQTHFYWGNVTADVYIIVQESSWVSDGPLHTVTRVSVWMVVEAAAIKRGEKRGMVSLFCCA